MERVIAADLPRLRRNFVTVQRLTPETAALERKLQMTKWFDYRFLSPEEATELFAQAYASAYEHYYGKYFSSVSAQGKTGMRQRLWKSSLREFTSFWRARQFADEIGVPYDQFVCPTFELANRRCWARLPRPNQFYSPKFRGAITEVVRERWREWTEDAIFTFSKLPQYRNEHFTGLPAQVAHRDWLISQLKARHGDPAKIAEACFVHGVLPIDRAIAEFGEEQFERANRYAAERSLVAAPAEPLSGSEARPSCFGFLNAYDDTAMECLACPMRATCSDATAFVMAQVTTKTGSENPRAERRRQQVRDRVRRHRAKGKSAAPSLFF
jgi:hypothetical protein